MSVKMELLRSMTPAVTKSTVPEKKITGCHGFVCLRLSEAIHWKSPGWKDATFISKNFCSFYLSIISCVSEWWKWKLISWLKITWKIKPKMSFVSLFHFEFSCCYFETHCWHERLRDNQRKRVPKWVGSFWRTNGHFRSVSQIREDSAPRFTKGSDLGAWSPKHIYRSGLVSF